ncbi:Hsp70 family protein [Micromonospora sp. NBC_01796]|uniref:Hsp70 family protein n=1 Tax=Micromonospora sp. NBC_01796 TaxID=2975987 RepID=UPI002DD8CBD5|nr:Hsp70 family protein [Micromonospora sp. NBC_01796]WSA85013.1 Hsp70 family protein [Micromonospora sp. NBC_01796]
MNTTARLAVDLGTTHTVAVIHRPGQPPRPLLFDGTPLLPSGVYLDPTGTTHTGRDAHRLASNQPDRFEPHPKRRIDDGTILLGDNDIPIEQLLAAGLRRVADEAHLTGINPTTATVLTCPADWAQPRRNLLRTAARQAGLGEVTLIDEPVAAAHYCLDLLGPQLPPGATLAIFDFGGGTLDVTVIRREPTGSRVLATGGLDDLGGVDIDDALVAHLGQLIALRDPDLWQRLHQPTTPVDRRDRQTLWTEVRAAKEMLSRTATAPVTVPGRTEPLHLTREELDRIAAPLIARAVDETRRVLQRAGTEPTTLAALLLVGGSSRMPLVASRLHARLGIAPAVPEQPELPVAYGALRHPTTPHPAPTHTPPPPPAPPRPVAHPAPTPPPTPTPARRRTRRTVITATALTAVAACIGTTITSGNWLADRVNGALNQANRIPGLTDNNQPTDGTLKPGQTRPAATSGAAAVTIADQNVISAVTTAGNTEITALPGNGGAAHWTVKVPIEPADLTLTTIDAPHPADDLIIIDGADSATDDGKPVRAVLDATTGKLLWRDTWTNRYDVAYYGTNAIVEARGSIDGNAVLSIDLRTGKQRWNRAGNTGLLILERHRIEAMRQWPTAPDPTAGTLPATAGALRDTTTTSPTVVELNTSTGKGYTLDVTTGKVKSSGNLPLDEERWVAYDNLVIGKLSTKASPARDVLAAYNAADLKQKWKQELPAGVDIENVKPCGPHLICAAIDEARNNRVIALDTRTGKQAWSTPTESADDENWYAGATVIVSGDSTFDRIAEARILNHTDGRQLRQLPQFTNTTATDGTNLVLQEYNGATKQWQIAVQEITTGRTTGGADVGAEPPEHVTINKDLVAVLTADRRALSFAVTDLAK